jgi:hypothetical protein
MPTLICPHQEEDRCLFTLLALISLENRFQGLEILARSSTKKNK